MRMLTNIKGALFALAIASPVVATGGGFSNLYVLGDSLSDQGNLFAVAGIPRADHYYLGRFSNGENYADVLAKELGVTLTPSIAGGSNFAFGGTRTDYNTVELDATKPLPVEFLGNQGNIFPEDSFPWTLDTQRADFSGRVIQDPGALYVVFSGSNDLVDLIEMRARCFSGLPGSDVFCLERGDPVVAIPVVVGSINNAIAAFVAAGAQEILVPNMPNLGVVPGITTVNGGALVPLATGLTAQYNSALNEMLAEWQSYVNIIPMDTFSLLNEVVDDPAAFGFTNATEACYTGFVTPLEEDDGIECDNPDEYVFWDKEHPTTALHKVLAEMALASFVPDMLDYLSLQVSELNVKNKVRNSLDKKLVSASQKLAQGKSADAVAKLEDFIEKVEEKQGKEIMEEDALSMIMRAEKIIALLEAE